MALFFKSYLKKLEDKRQSIIKRNAVPQGLEKIFNTPVFKDDEKVFDKSLVCLDFETSGLDFKNDKVLSIGHILIENGEIRFNSSYHCYINQSFELKSGSAIINQITPDVLINGKDVHEAFNELLDTICGKIVICHAATIERSFILQTLNVPLDFPLPIIFLDTMKIEKSFMSFSGKTDDLSLASIRKKRGLPSYIAHNALADSVATAEVFLAQMKELYNNVNPNLYDVVKRSHC